MKKTKNITKYNLEWQVLRISLKGKYNDDLSYKFTMVREYFNKTGTYDRWERVYNWLQGLERGFKAHNEIEKIFNIKYELRWFEINKPNINHIDNSPGLTYENFSLNVLKKLYEDLCKTNEKWLKNGYLHQECNLFLDDLYNYLKDKVNFKDSYALSKVIDLRKQSKLIKNNHQFFF